MRSLAFVTESLEPISWGSIERVEVGHNAAGRGALWGALTGTALALVYFATIDTPEQDDAPLATPAAMAMGAVLGMGIGAMHTRWVPFYPPADKPTGRPVSR
jgi:hypothetical protein